MILGEVSMILVEVLMILVAIFFESAEFKLSLTLGETADVKILQIKLGLLMMPRILLSSAENS